MKVTDLTQREGVIVDIPLRLQEVLDTYWTVFPKTCQELVKEFIYQEFVDVYNRRDCLIIPDKLMKMMKEVDNEWRCKEVDFWTEERKNKPANTYEANMWLRDMYKKLEKLKEEFYKINREGDESDVSSESAL